MNYINNHNTFSIIHIKRGASKMLFLFTFLALLYQIPPLSEFINTEVIKIRDLESIISFNDMRKLRETERI